MHGRDCQLVSPHPINCGVCLDPGAIQEDAWNPFPEPISLRKSDDDSCAKVVEVFNPVGIIHAPDLISSAFPPPCSKARERVKMDAVSIESLTPMEARCLRTLRDVRGIGPVAATLGISESTVKTHLTSARRKLGASSSFEAARRFAEAADPHPKRPSPDRPIPPTACAEPDFGRRVVGPGLDDAVNEERASFVHQPRATDRPVSGFQQGAPVLSPIALAVLIAFVVVLLVLAAPPFAERLGWLGGLFYNPF